MRQSLLLLLHQTGTLGAFNQQKAFFFFLFFFNFVQLRGAQNSLYDVVASLRGALCVALPLRRDPGVSRGIAGCGERSQKGKAWGAIPEGQRQVLVWPRGPAELLPTRGAISSSGSRSSQRAVAVPTSAAACCHTPTFGKQRANHPHGLQGLQSRLFLFFTQLLDKWICTAALRPISAVSVPSQPAGKGARRASLPVRGALLPRHPLL